MLTGRTKKKLKNVEIAIYREMFKRATPPADFNKLLNNPPEANWNNRFYLNELTQQKIIDRICIKNKLTNEEKSLVGRTIRFGYCPSSKEIKYNPYLEKRFVGVKKKKTK